MFSDNSFQITVSANDGFHSRCILGKKKSSVLDKNIVCKDGFHFSGLLFLFPNLSPLPFSYL